MPIRVTHLINSLASGGAERLILDAAPFWDTSRFDVRVVYLLAAQAQEEEIARSTIPMRWGGLRSPCDPMGMGALARKLDELRPDLLHTHLMLADVLGRRYGRSRRVPVVTTLHTQAERLFRRPGMAGRLEGMVYRRAMTATASAVTTACSRVVAASVMAACPGLGEVGVIENGIDLDRVSDSHARPRDRVRAELGVGDGVLCLAVGRLDLVKGHDVLLRAVTMTRSPHLAVAIAGTGSEEVHLRDLAGRLGVSGRVLFLGRCGDVGSLLHAADLFVLPSRREGLPISLIEAMACGLPIVATDVGGVRDVVEPSGAGIVVPPEDPAALTEAVDALATDPERRRALGASAREAAHVRYDIRRWVSEYEALYEKLLDVGS